LNTKEPCILCGALIKQTAPVVISPWIRNLGIKKRTSQFLNCEKCNFGFFSYRYDAPEMGKIYSGYRNETYFRIRNNWEPWYSKSYNSNHDSAKWIHSRKLGIEQFLVTFIGESKLRIADVGGDAGQFIPDLASKKYVVDPSRKPSAYGVESVTDFEDLPEVDLIIYAHVLEHVSDPVLEVSMLFSKASKVYIEVPYGVPRITPSRRSMIRFLRKILRSLHPFLWKNETRPSTGRSVKSEDTLTQSEHLNFFSEEAIEQLSLRVSAKVEIRRAQIETPDYMKAEVLQCLLFKIMEPEVTLVPTVEEK
jgi:hypothetical protein